MDNKYLREIKPEEMKKWKPQKQSMALEIIEDFVRSNMEMAQVSLDGLPEPEKKGSSRKPSSKQDSFASSFYAWKKKASTKASLRQLQIDDILIIRRDKEVALKRVWKGRQ